MTTPPQNPPGSGPSTSSASPGNAQGSGDGSQTRETAQRLAADAQDRTKAEVDRARDTAARKAEALAQSARAAADALGQDDIGHMSEYITRLADGMGRFAEGLRHKSGDEIARDIGRMARENPALFVAGGVAVGFGLSRFARASQHRSHAMVPAEAARADIGPTQDRSSESSTVYSAGSLDSESLSGSDSPSTGGMH